MRDTFILQKLEQEKGVKMTICKSGFLFSKEFCSELKNSRYVQLYLSKDKKEVAIRPCDKGDEAAIRLNLSSGGYPRIVNRFAINLAKMLCKEKTVCVGKKEDDYLVFSIK